MIDDEGTPLPVGEVGEIVHRSPHACLGYYNDEEKTAAAFAGGWFPPATSEGSTPTDTCPWSTARRT